MLLELVSGRVTTTTVHENKTAGINWESGSKKTTTANSLTFFLEEHIKVFCCVCTWFINIYIYSYISIWSVTYMYLDKKIIGNKNGSIFSDTLKREHQIVNWLADPQRGQGFRPSCFFKLPLWFGVPFSSWVAPRKNEHTNKKESWPFRPVSWKINKAVHQPNSLLLWQTYAFPWQKSSNWSGWHVTYTRPKADVKNKIDQNWLRF